MEADSDDDEYGRPSKKAKSRDKRPLPHPEMGRATMHTLEENLEQIMSGSFEESFLGGAPGGQESFLSSMDDDFGFGDCGDFDLGDIGGELAKELGGGWASSAVQPRSVLHSQTWHWRDCSRRSGRPSVEEERELHAYADQAHADMDPIQEDNLALTEPVQHLGTDDVPRSVPPSARKRVSD